MNCYVYHLHDSLQVAFDYFPCLLTLELLDPSQMFAIYITILSLRRFLLPKQEGIEKHI